MKKGIFKMNIAVCKVASQREIKFYSNILSLFIHYFLVHFRLNIFSMPFIPFE